MGFFFNDTATTEIYTLSLHDALPISIPEDDEKAQQKLEHYYEILRERIFREQVIEKHRRPDGRAFDEIRPIWIEAGILPRTHRSEEHTSGLQSQSNVVCSLLLD